MIVNNVCTPAPCDKFPDGTISWQTTCSGAAPGTVAVVTKTPSMAPIKAGSPTAMPTTSPKPTASPSAAVIYVYNIVLVLYGLTPADFAIKDAAPNHALTKTLQKQISLATGESMDDHCLLSLTTLSNKP